ncbi:GAF domain-containing protein [Hymenobacter sp. BT523]|uniref:GAF domain-containing protein n=1 Tax=Hymenobacter sp. BT523 TaxID=2795725 RepID=UPI0018EA94F5|nr:GAF domain-containing protein [Hymenobacter sp. BT523]MBJ6109956.1 GAF domain-containing protein [Hymenobacter sp. BT523]
MSTTALHHPELIPAFEPQRLAALRRYHVLSVPGEEAFNTLVAIVARVFNVPVALVSLVQAEEVQFVGNAGLPGVAAVPRADSLCSVAILQDGITLFEDLLQRPCHLTTDAAARTFNLQFYAGCALRTSGGMPIGALCVMDRQARRFSMAERTLLNHLGDVAMSLLDIRAAQPDDPALFSSLRTVLDEHVSQSLDRLDTLAGLGEWEDPDSAEALAYQQSGLDEATHITRLIQQELQATLKRLGR